MHDTLPPICSRVVVREWPDHQADLLIPASHPTRRQEAAATVGVACGSSLPTAKIGGSGKPSVRRYGV
jgi:hypothetical protein